MILEQRPLHGRVAIFMLFFMAVMLFLHFSDAGMVRMGVRVEATAKAQGDNDCPGWYAERARSPGALERKMLSRKQLAGGRISVIE